MNLEEKLAFVSFGLYNGFSPKGKELKMKAMSINKAREIYLPVIMGEIARCDTFITVICEDIAENGITIEKWFVLKHYISEKNVFVQALED